MSALDLLRPLAPFTHLELGDALRAAEVEDVSLWQCGLVLRQRVPLAEMTGGLGVWTQRRLVHYDRSVKCNIEKPVLT